MKTEQEIVERIQTRKDALFDFTLDALLPFLSFENAKPFLQEHVTAEQWEDARTPLTRENVIRAIQGYLPFAFEKAEDQRGLSASRSISKMQAWLWALGDDEMVEFCSAHYAPYGMPALEAIRDKYTDAHG